jgi:hypothetical protein
MTRTIASLALFICALVAGCAADQSGATSPQADQAYTPTGSNVPRRTAPKADKPAAQAGQSGTTKPVP